MSRRQATSSKRLEQRAERNAKRPGAAPAPRRRRANRVPATKARSSFNWLPVLAGLGVIGVVALLAYAVVSASGGSSGELAGWQKAQLDDSSLLPGTYYAPHPGEDGTVGTSDDRKHFANGVKVPTCTDQQISQVQVSNPLCYTSNPPTSGPHGESPMPFGVLQNPAPKENLIHNMEHGGTVVWYNTDDQSVIDKLESVVKNELDRRRLVVMTRYSDMEPNTIALTAWTRLDKFPVSEYTDKRVRDFIDEHDRRFNPEGF